MKKLILSALLLCAVGCKPVTTNQPLAPGAYNQTDQVLYQSLMSVQASLNNLKTTLKTADAQTAATLKPYVNQAITDYNVAEVAYQTYHAALASNPNASSANVRAAIVKVQTDLKAVK